MPATDALDPDEDGSYPFWPRRADGTTDPERMPRGPRTMRGTDGKRLVYRPGTRQS